MRQSILVQDTVDPSGGLRRRNLGLAPWLLKGEQRRATGNIEQRYAIIYASLRQVHAAMKGKYEKS
jgi:hypothetical protein